MAVVVARVVGKVVDIVVDIVGRCVSLTSVTTNETIVADSVLSSESQTLK